MSEEKKYTRWYDQEEQLSLVVNALEFADDDVKLSIAADLIQMVMAKRQVDSDDFIDDLNEEYVPVRKRWYDKFESLHSAMEMLKHMDPKERPEILKEMINSMIYFQSSKTNNENL